MKPHPAVWIAAWSVAAIAYQSLGIAWLGALAAPIFFLIARFAAPEALRLLRRSRWLLFGIIVMFVLGTPGERLPGPLGAAGVTIDGLLRAGEHALRLVLLLTTLAWLLGYLRQEGLLAGLHCLLRPWGKHRDRLVVRLLLTLEQVNLATPEQDWRAWLACDGTESISVRQYLHLDVPRLRSADRLFMLACGVILLLVLVR